MIDTEQALTIDFAALTAWLNKVLAPLVPDLKQASIIPRSWEAKGESRFLSVISEFDDVEIDDLVRLVADEHTRSGYYHFHADVVVSAAITAGELPEAPEYWLYATW